MDKTKQKKPSGFARLMQYAGRRKYLTYLSFVLSFVSSLVALIPLLYIFFIIKEVIEVAPDFAKAVSIVHNGIVAVVFSLAAILIYFAALMCSHLSAFRIGSNIKRELLKHIVKLPIGFSDRTGSGRVRSIINDSSTAAETYLAHNLPDMAGAIATPIGMVVIMFAFDWRFGLISLIPVVLAFMCMSKMIGPAMQEDMKNYNDALEGMNNEAVEYVRGIPVVKTFGQTVHSFSRFKNSIEKYHKFCMQYTKRARVPMLMFLVFVHSTFAFLIALTFILTKGGSNITNEIVLNFIFYVIITPIIATTMNKVLFMEEGNMTVVDALGRVDSILTLKPFDEPGLNLHPTDNSVEFKNVSFRYSENADYALKNLSFKAEGGKTLALVGPSGGGKTTAAGLISRFWDVTEGSVLIGGTDVRDIEKTELMNTVSYVFQDSRLLKKSIFENVRLAKPSASREDVINALCQAQCDDIIEKLPNGIDTVIGTKGVYLSGGEMQRIAIARAFLKNAPIVVLDEATAFADPENEYLVQKSFAELANNKTLIIIAHRLSTIKNADNIIVLDSGRIAEEGKHDALIAENGLYKKMWDDYMKSAMWKVGGGND